MYFSFIISILLFGANSLEATDFVLANENGLAENYSEIVERIKEGDSLTFSNGEKFRITKVLGSGNTTLVLKTLRGTALRVPLNSGVHIKTRIPISEYINHTIDGHETVSKNGVKTVDLISFLRNEYVEVNYIDYKFSLEDFLSGNIDPIYLSKKDQIIQALSRWYETTHKMITIGDFASGQLIFNGSEWILSDWTNMHMTLKEYYEVNKIERISANIPFNTLSTAEMIVPEILHSSFFPPRELKELESFLIDVVYQKRFQSFCLTFFE